MQPDFRVLKIRNYTLASIQIQFEEQLAEAELSTYFLINRKYRKYIFLKSDYAVARQNDQFISTMSISCSPSKCLGAPDKNAYYSNKLPANEKTINVIYYRSSFTLSSCTVTHFGCESRMS